MLLDDFERSGFKTTDLTQLTIVEGPDPAQALSDCVCFGNEAEPLVVCCHFSMSYPTSVPLL